MGVVEQYPGVVVESDGHGGFFLHQSHLIASACSKYGMEHSKAVPTPMEPGQISSLCLMDKYSVSTNDTNNIPYREAAGMLLYIATRTRPDIALAVRYVSRYCPAPGPIDWKAVQRIFRYFKTTH